MALVLKPMRDVGGNAVFITNIPQMPGISGAAFAGDQPISVRTIRQHTTPDFFSPRNSTWMAQCRQGSCAVGYLGGYPYTTEKHGYFFCDPTMVDYGTLTRTGRAPRYNLNSTTGLWKPHQATVGTAKVVGSAGSGSPTAEADIYEDRVRIVTPTGVVTANKIPSIQAASTTGFLAETHLDEQLRAATLTDPQIGGDPYGAARYLGGDVLVTFNADAGSNWDLYASVIDPVTLEATVFTIIVTANGQSTTTLTEADMLAAGIARWDQVYFAFNFTGSPDVPPEPIYGYINPFGTDYATVDFFPTLDIPPWYTMPGIDGLIPGGYFA